MNKHENEERRIKISNGLLTRSSLQKKDYYPEEYSKEIQASNVVLIPNENYKNFKYPVFPEQTKSFYDFLKDKSSDSFKPSICISDEDYYELELHADIVTIPSMIVTFLVLPILTRIIANYLYDLIKKRRTEINVKVSITVEKNGDSKKMDFEGKVEEFEKCFEIASGKLFGD
ncbi:MAG: hypothetical protein U9R23_06570 [Candidatus Cloacimonadota bacterium]|nr:hypothetical protein [Candidatus Cloacimonadota bacterium]